MAIIPQQQLFRWDEIERLGDLERLRLVLEHMPDDELMKGLEKERARGRDDYPVRAVWNCILAGVVFQHASVESLRRELLRNAQLRWLCGLNGVVPPSWVYSRFLKKLLARTDEIDALFDLLVAQLMEELPDLGKNLAIDGKAIWSHGRPPRKSEDEKRKAADGRRESDADWGTKVYKGKRQDGTPWQKIVSWFGFKLHLVVDADYELPVAFAVSRASESEMPHAHQLLDEMKQRQPLLLERCGMLLADKGYDDTKLLKKLWDEYEIKPVIDIRNMWRDGEATHLLESRDNVVYDYCGNVYCHCPATGRRREMAYGGFEKKRKTLKYRCPARHYGIECKSTATCASYRGVRIALETDRRIFVPVARSSYSWKTAYKKRTAVERVNSRLDVSFGFENHFIRGLCKMKVRCGLALCVMLAMALGRVRNKQLERLRSLVAA